MTFVGKILVITITAFSFLFLGFALMTYTTATDWKTKSGNLSTEIQKATTQLKEAQGRVADAEAKIKSASEEHTAVIKKREARVAELEKRIKDAEAEIVAERTKLDAAEKEVKTSLDEAIEKKSKLDMLAETLGKARTQQDQYNLQNSELSDRIRILERQKATAEQNRKAIGSVSAIPTDS